MKGWECKKVATRREVQSLVGLLNFVGEVSPPTRIYTNHIFNFLRGMPQDGYVEITREFLEDVRFFSAPHATLQWYFSAGYDISSLHGSTLG